MRRQTYLATETNLNGANIENIDIPKLNMSSILHNPLNTVTI